MEGEFLTGQKPLCQVAARPTGGGPVGRALGFAWGWEKNKGRFWEGYQILNVTRMFRPRLGVYQL